MENTLTPPVPLRRDLETPEIIERIAALKERLGKRLVILGHHYQVDDVVRFADFTGDSFKLAKLAAEQSEAEFIVFLGVHFMAESTDILASDHQKVILPDLAAGCSMADMANIDQTETAFAELNVNDEFTPITYMNSTAAIKAFCGRNGGVVCTSSNAEKVITWALERKPRILFLPDQHLGRNVSHDLGIALDDMAIWDPHALPEVNLANGCDKAKVVLWKGHCSVHTKFLPEHVDQMRELHPGINIIAHPECPFEVIQKADFSGSTENIINRVNASPPGSKWAIGTEINLVSRLAQQNPDKTVISLSGIACLCATMYRVDPVHLLWSLENLEEGHVVNQITVDKETANDALTALNRMLALI